MFFNLLSLVFSYVATATVSINVYGLIFWSISAISLGAYIYIKKRNNEVIKLTDGLFLFFSAIMVTYFTYMIF